MGPHLAYGLLSTSCECCRQDRTKKNENRNVLPSLTNKLKTPHSSAKMRSSLVVLNKVFCFLLLEASSEAVNGSGLSTDRETGEPLRGTGGFTSLSCSFEVYFCHTFQLRSLKSHSFRLWQLHSPVYHASLNLWNNCPEITQECSCTLQWALKPW